MSSVGSFGTFSTARLAIYAAQKGLSVSGNNIANTNTEGYTRQRLNQSSFKSGAADRYHSRNDVHVGNGVFCDSVSQIRDPYLDIRYRTTSSEVGYNDQMLYGLNNVASILDEVADGEDKNGIIHAQLNELSTALRQLSIHAGEQGYDDIVRQKADSICQSFRSYANKLEELRQNTETEMRTDINEINDILTGIRDLNSAIRKSDIHGDSALEMRDDRNLLIDKLSRYLKIDVVYSMEDIGAGRQVEKLTIKLGDANPSTEIAARTGEDIPNAKNNDRAMLVDGIYCTQLTTPAKNEDNLTDENNDPYLYVDKNGEGTNDPRKADQVFDERYTITLSELKDSKDRLWKEEDKTFVTTVKQLPDGMTDADLGVQNTDTVYEDGLEVETLTTYTKNPDNTYSKQVVVNKYTRDIVLDDNDLYGGLQASRELLTEEAEFASQEDIDLDEQAATKRGIPYYQKSLDLLAQNFAKEFNKLNTQYISTEKTSTVPDPNDTTTPNDFYDPTKTIWIDIDGQAKQYCVNEDGYLVGIHDVGDGVCVIGGEGKPYPIKVEDVEAVADGRQKVPLLDDHGNPILDANGNAVEGYKLPAPSTKVPLVGVPTTGADMAYIVQNHGSSPEEFEDVFKKLELKPGDEVEVKDMAGLFSNSGDGNDMTGITAANISVSQAWALQQAHVICRPEDPDFIVPTDYPEANEIPVEQSTQCENIDHMLTLIDKKTLYNPQDLNAAQGESSCVRQFEGSFQEYLNTIVSNLGGDQSSFDTNLTTYYQSAVDIDMSRASVSAVDMNDEAMDLMRYSKALNAAYRLMTTIDEALDRLINSTGRVGL